MVTSGDGALACLDLHTMKVLGQSDNMEDELLSCCVVKNGTKVVAGSQGGNLNIWNYGDWIDANDRFRSPSSVDAGDGESERRYRFNWKFRRVNSRDYDISKPNVRFSRRTRRVSHRTYAID